MCETFDRKSGITPVPRTIFFWSTFSVWPPAAILNLDVWLVKIQEMIPGNKHILLKTSFSCEIQQVIWIIWLKTETNGIGRWRPSWILMFRLIKIKNDARNRLSMPHLVGKVILHGFLWPFTFKLHFQYGRRRPSWILMVGLVKIQKRCQKWILHAKISGKSGITQLSISICAEVIFPIWPPAAILDCGFSQIPPPFSRGSWGLIFF